MKCHEDITLHLSLTPVTWKPVELYFITELLVILRKVIKQQRQGHAMWISTNSNRWKLDKMQSAGEKIGQRGIHLGLHSLSGKILQWRHNGRDCVSNHQPHHCLLNRLVRRRSKKISKLGVNGLCAGNSPVTGEFLAQIASNVENLSVWWCHRPSYGKTSRSERMGVNMVV